MKKAIIIGASSGIGRELSNILAKNGFEVGLMARRLELLNEVRNQIPTKAYVGHIDISDVTDAMQKVNKMIQEMDGMDLLVINSGVGFLNPELNWEKEKQTIDVNTYGFCALAGLGYNFFCKQNFGHLVGISSIGALRGNDIAPAYNASKAFMSNYLEGLQKKSFKEKRQITVTDIKPGFVDTDMAKGEGKFWVATPQEASEQIFRAILSKKKHAYITRRWTLIAWLIKLMPRFLYERT
jgi:short-subunit dehydrogenase